MSRLVRRFEWVLLVWAATACAQSSTSPVDLAPEDRPGQIVVAFGTPTASLPRDAYTIAEARITGDTLRLRITHGGGCRTHEYGLIAWNGWLESNPVQAGVLLLHNANDDACEALLQANLRFDLTPLRQAYATAYGGPGGTVVINLDDPSHGPGPPLHELTYSF